MKHSKKYEKVKDYYDRRLWGKVAVRNAVKKAWITADEYEEITGDKYVTAEND